MHLPTKNSFALTETFFLPRGFIVEAFPMNICDKRSP